MRAYLSLCVFFLGFCACKRNPAEAAEPVPPASSLTAAQRKPVEKIFDSGMGEGWLDFGWSNREVKSGAPVTVDLSGYGGWIAAKFGMRPKYGGLVFKLKAPAGAPIAVLLKSPGQPDFKMVRLRADHVYEEKDGWKAHYVSMRELNPEARTFDHVIFFGETKGSLPGIKIDGVWLTEGSAVQAAGGTDRPVGPPVDRALALRCDAAATPISPDIYGIALHVTGFSDTHQFDLSATARRWGGNPTSRFNWKLGNAWNTASDWYFENVNYSGRPNYSYEDFLEENRAKGLRTALTVPTIGWVAKDTSSAGFPKELLPDQDGFDPYRPTAGSGKGKDGKPLAPPPPTTTSVPAPPEFIGEWIRTIREKDKKRGRSVHLYILDNEPMIWNNTHRDVHPEPVSYDELLDRTVRYATAIRQADPEAKIAGPAEWGWTNYLYSSVDTAAGVRLRPDRRKHGDLPLVVWYLQQLRAHEQKTGVKLIDVLDLHFYPQTEAGVFGASKVDPKSNALRLRSTRSLWDPSYTDESWIKDQIQLIPRMQQWIRENYPGLGTAIGEYNFGAEDHMSGGLAQAEALGRFGQYGLTAAYYWTYPPKDSPAFWAFRAYRNYDGKGGRFLDVAVPTTSAEDVSLFASRDEAKKRWVLIALNLAPRSAAKAKLALEGCGKLQLQRAFTYGGDPKGFVPLAGASATEWVLPPYSINVLELSAAEGP